LETTNHYIKVDVPPKPLMLIITQIFSFGAVRSRLQYAINQTSLTSLNKQTPAPVPTGQPSQPSTLPYGLQTFQTQPNVGRCCGLVVRKYQQHRRPKNYGWLQTTQLAFFFSDWSSTYIHPTKEESRLQNAVFWVPSPATWANRLVVTPTVHKARIPGITQPCWIMPKPAMKQNVALVHLQRGPRSDFKKHFIRIRRKTSLRNALNYSQDNTLFTPKYKQKFHLTHK